MECIQERVERTELVAMSIDKALSSFSFKRNGAVTRGEEGQQRIFYSTRNNMFVMRMVL